MASEELRMIGAMALWAVRHSKVDWEEAFKGGWEAARNIALVDAGEVRGDAGIPATGWQPIETAPKDGNEMLLWADHVELGYWEEDGDYWADSSAGGVVHYVTHWMHLPAAPGQSQGEMLSNPVYAEDCLPLDQSVALAESRDTIPVPADVWKQVEDFAEFIRVLLINELDEPLRQGFWRAVDIQKRLDAAKSVGVGS